MKTSKSKNVILAIAVVFSGIVTIFSYSIATSSSINAGSGIKIQLPKPGSLNGTTEFHFIPIGENRVWHIVNKYNLPGSGEGPGYNVSNYIFSIESVFVKNEYDGIPGEEGLDMALALTFLNANNSNN